MFHRCIAVAARPSLALLLLLLASFVLAGCPEDTDLDGDGVSEEEGDCNDDDNTVFPGAPEICNGADDDCDGQTDELLDGDGDGAFLQDDAACPDGDDCDDDDATAYPGADELCDGLDNDCDGVADNGLDADTWWVDGDADGFGTGELTVTCDGVAPAGTVSADGDEDCDDTQSSVFPGAVEVCDGVDQNCDSVVDDGFDVDLDTFTSCGADGVPNSGDEDCDDADDAVYPGAPELCNGFDEDCDGEIGLDEGDFDLDGVLTCADCDDDDVNNFPGNTEVCDGADNDCDPLTEAGIGETDGDSDGSPLCADCDDDDGANFPGNPEVCDGGDNDCDAGTEAVGGEGDVDADGSPTCADCDDDDPNAFPGNPEVCDGLDNDCDGAVTQDETDGDTDMYIDCSPYVDNGATGILGGGDCDDITSSIFPGATEVCDAVDQDCDGSVDEDFDTDGDGVSACGPDGIGGNVDDDCNDGNAAVNPTAPELCDGIDNNCNSDVDDEDSNFVGADFDNDGDDALACGGTDCDDNDPTVDGLDADGDGESICDGDCLDDNPWANTAAEEACDGVDTDCDGLDDTADTVVADWDGDGFDAEGCGIGGADCDDLDKHVFPEELYTSGAQPDCLPVVYPGTFGSWNFARISLPWYFLDDATGMHYLYFRAHENQDEQAIGAVSSSDGLTWGDPVGPLFERAEDAWDDRNISNAAVARVPGLVNEYVMLYHGRDPLTGLRQIGLASAPDPLGPWERVDPNDGSTLIADPVIAPSLLPAHLDSGRTLHPALWYDAVNSTLHAWYSGRTDAVGTLRIFHATSVDGGVTWTKTDDDVTPGPDVVLEPTDAWEGSRVAEVSWIEDASNPGTFEFFYEGSSTEIGAASGTPTDWVRSEVNPVLSPSATCGRLDGLNVTGRGIYYEAAADTYHWYYGAATSINVTTCPGNEDDIYFNFGEQVSYVARATNVAPELTIVAGTPAANMTFSGDVTDSAPDQVIVTLEGPGETFLGTATVTPTGNTDTGVQTTGWTVNVTGLAAGSNEITASAIDEAGVVRTVSTTVVVP